MFFLWISISLLPIEFSTLSWTVGGGSTCRAHLSRPPWMRISLPRHDLLEEERLPISQRRRAKSLFLNGLLLGSVCTGIQVKLINHCQAVSVKREITENSEGLFWVRVRYLKGYKTLGNKLISCLDHYQKIEGILNKAGFTGFYVFLLRPDHPGESTLSSTRLHHPHCFRLKSGRASQAAKRLGDLLQTEWELRLCQNQGASVQHPLFL